MKAVLVSFLLLLPVALFGATHTITSSGFTFSPPVDTITVGDTVNFALASIHNAVEVSQSTWNANDTTRLPGGFGVPFGGGQVVSIPLGTHFFVCQAHASMGMKGIITVVNTPPPPPPPQNSLTVRNLVDQDGDFNTTGDEALKNWHLSLYHDSISVATRLATVASGTSITVDSLPAGTYIAVEADSAGWSHISVSVDGFPQGSITFNQFTLVVSGSNESHTIDFINYAPHTIINLAETFHPDSLVILQGSLVHFVLDPSHDAREVSESTWVAGGTTSNGGFEVPFGGGDVTISDTGTHYYVCIVHVATGMKGRIFVKPVASTVTLSEFYNGGWNLVSLPLQPNDNTVSTLYPTATSKAFTYQGSYIPNTNVATKVGYWLKFGDTASVSLTGLSIVGDSMPVAKGWNMIGSISSPLAMSTVVSSPPGIISSLLYGYNGSYFPTDTIEPGFGYWLRTDNAGVLIAGSNGNVPLAADFSKQIGRSAGTLTVSDAEGHQKNLYLVNGDTRLASLEHFSVLPPAPPEGVFDVRFASGGQIEALASSARGTVPVQLSSVVYPLTLRWNGPQIAVLIDGVRFTLDRTSPLIFREPVRSFAVTQSGTVGPSSGFRLDPAFPNPCNPSTIVRYALPSESRITLRVYNLLGQLVATLVEGVQDAGERRVVWSTAGNGSGVYFVAMNATPVAGGRSYSRVIKVLVQK